MGAMFPMPRILWNMSEDGLVYEWTARINKKKVPQNATIVATVVAGMYESLFFNSVSSLELVKNLRSNF